jgi:hypothetical protein
MNGDRRLIEDYLTIEDSNAESSLLTAHRGLSGELFDGSPT